MCSDLSVMEITLAHMGVPRTLICSKSLDLIWVIWVDKVATSQHKSLTTFSFILGLEALAHRSAPSLISPRICHSFLNLCSFAAHDGYFKT